ncbi:MAG: hypothetical protein AAFS04_18985, partial [Cyanobacteria bacterium J06631_9]
MQENQKNWRLAILKQLATTSGILTSWLTLALIASTPASSQVGRFTETPGQLQPTPQIIITQATPQTSPETIDQPTEAPIPAQPQDVERALDQANNLITLMLGLIVLILGGGIVMLWFLRRSVVSQVATAVRTQLNEMTELENKVYNATRSLNRVLTEADDLSGELQGRSSNFQREVAAQREVLYNLIEELSEFKVQTARSWERQLEDINGKLEATATDFYQVAIELRDQARQRFD